MGLSAQTEKTYLISIRLIVNLCTVTIGDGLGVQVATDLYTEEPGFNPWPIPLLQFCTLLINFLSHFFYSKFICS